jgi:hypothetical protein
MSHILVGRIILLTIIDMTEQGHDAGDTCPMYQVAAFVHRCTLISFSWLHDSPAQHGRPDL